MAKFEVFKAIDAKWYWHLRGSNGEIMANSQGYGRRDSARRGAKRFAELVPQAKVINVTPGGTHEQK